MATSNGESSTDSRTRTSTSVLLPCTKPNSEKIKALLDRTGYTLIISPTQRKYGGPPPEWVGPDPDKCCQITCSNFPFYMYEDQLVPFFEEHGTLWEFRLLMDRVSGQNRGFAFVTYTNKVDAKQAHSALDNHEITPGKRLHLTLNQPNTRIFVGNIPKWLGEFEIYEEYRKLTPGLSKVIIYKSQTESTPNRGFCFLDYDDNKNASYARRKLADIKVFGRNIDVNWANPQNEPDTAVMDQVKRLFVRNLSSEIDEETFYRLFAPFGDVEHVKRMKNFGFVHFSDRNSAMKAMSKLNGTELNGLRIEVSLAKPKLVNTATEQGEQRRLQMITAQVESIGIAGPSGYTANQNNEHEADRRDDRNRRNEPSGNGNQSGTGNRYH